MLCYSYSYVCVVMMKIHLADLRPGQTVDEWYNLLPVNLTTKSDMGALRVSIRYLHEVIMPAKEYSSLKEVGMSLKNYIVSVLCDMICFNMIS